MSTKDKLVKAKVVSIEEEGVRNVEGFSEYATTYQKVKVEFTEGAESGKQTTLEYGGKFNVDSSQKLKKDQMVVVSVSTQSPNNNTYQIVDLYRLNQLGYIGFIFLVLVLFLSRWKGVGSFLGMFLSLIIIIKFIIPQILSGSDPLFTSIAGAILILVSSIYLAHGFSKQTTIAVVSTTLTLIATGLLSTIFVNFTHLSGLTSEESLFLQFGAASSINFKGLLLGGMIIGFLGVLDDITTGLAATVFELKKVNPKMKMHELISSSMNIGREHISSLVNTLVLAYAGASLPTFLFIVLNPQEYPLWFIINSEVLSEEIVRTLSGSIGLLLAVPITAVIASWVVSRKKLSIS